MTSATPLQIEAACLTRSADDAWRHLNGRNLYCSRSQCATMISRLIARKERQPLPQPGGAFVNMTSVDISAFDAEMGSKRLLAAHLLAGKHWITDPRRFAVACREAGVWA